MDRDNRMTTWWAATRRHQFRVLPSEWCIKKLSANFERKYFGKQGGNSISKHALRVGTATFKFEGIGERLQACQLTR
jgi:hypothetical protein